MFAILPSSTTSWKGEWSWRRGSDWRFSRTT